MKSKNINRIKPYCYILTRISDGMRYHGLRWDNVRLNRLPKDDFGKYYFTSRSSLKKEFKKNKENFKYKITYTFENKKEAQEYEVKFNKKIINNKKWLNQSAYPHLIQSNKGKERIRLARLGSKLSQETIAKIKKGGTGIKKKPRTVEQKKIISLAVKKSYLNRNVWNKGLKMSPETRDKLSRSLKGRKAWNKGKSVFIGKNNPFYGRKHSAETLNKMRIARAKFKNNPTKKMIEGRKKQALKMKGRHYQTEESKKKISQANIGNKYNLGRVMTQETKNKISNSNKGKIVTAATKRQISKTLKEFYKSLNPQR